MLPSEHCANGPTDRQNTAAYRLHPADLSRVAQRCLPEANYTYLFISTLYIECRWELEGVGTRIAFMPCRNNRKEHGNANSSEYNGNGFAGIGLFNIKTCSRSDDGSRPVFARDQQCNCIRKNRLCSRRGDTCARTTGSRKIQAPILGFTALSRRSCSMRTRKGGGHDCLSK